MSRKSNPGIVGDGLIKPENLVLLGTESYLGRVRRVTYPRYFRSSQISFTSFFSLLKGALGRPRTKLSSAASLGHLWPYIFELWAITFFGLDLWTLYEQVGLAYKLLGPTIAHHNPAVQHLGWKGGFW